jgi:serine/threonine protein kinase
MSSAPLVYVDFEAANVLLSEQGEVKLADFGVAKQLTQSVCKGNTFVGSRSYCLFQEGKQNFLHCRIVYFSSTILDGTGSDQTGCIRLQG